MSNTLKSIIIILSIATAVSAGACDKHPKRGDCTKSDGGNGHWRCEKNSITGCYHCQCTSL